MAPKKPKAQRNKARLRMMIREAEDKTTITTDAIAAHVYRDSKAKYRLRSAKRMVRELETKGILRKMDPEDPEADPWWDLIDPEGLRAMVNAHRVKKPSQRPGSGRTMAMTGSPDSNDPETAQASTGEPGASDEGDGNAQNATIVQAFDHERPRQADGHLVRQAIRKRWETDQRIRDALMARVGRRGLETEDDETLARMVRLYLDAERQNQIDEHKETPDEVIIHARPVSVDERRAALAGAVAAEVAKRAQRLGISAAEYRERLNSDSSVSEDGHPGSDGSDG